MRDARKLRLVDRGGEAGHRVVRRVRLEHQPALRPQRLLEVARVRAVGGADLDQPAARGAHDLGHAERAADLDQLAARDHHLAPRRERLERQQHRRRAVVDHGGRLRAGQLQQQALDDAVAIAALAGRDVVLERGVTAHRVGGRRHRFLGEQRAAEVGVDHRSGEVVDAASCASRARRSRVRARRRQATRTPPAAPRPRASPCARHRARAGWRA